jgi:hypothetical protein
MIPPERSQPALDALQRVLVLARELAYGRRDRALVGDVLDVAEFLCRLIADPRDRSREFRSFLLDLRAVDARFGEALATFDDAPALAA